MKLQHQMPKVLYQLSSMVLMVRFIFVRFISGNIACFYEYKCDVHLHERQERVQVMQDSKRQ